MVLKWVLCVRVLKGERETESRNCEASSKKEGTAGKLSQGADTKGSRRQHEQLRVSPKSMETIGGL